MSSWLKPSVLRIPMQQQIIWEFYYYSKSLWNECNLRINNFRDDLIQEARIIKFHVLLLWIINKAILLLLFILSIKNKEDIQWTAKPLIAILMQWFSGVFSKILSLFYFANKEIRQKVGAKYNAKRRENSTLLNIFETCTCIGTYICKYLLMH